MTRMIKPATILAALALAGCGGGTVANDTPNSAPFPENLWHRQYGTEPWSPSDQNTFMRGCESGHSDENYCICVLGDVMAKFYPDVSELPNGVTVLDAGQAADENHQKFPGCDTL